MDITPNLPSEYGGPIKQLTCRMCKSTFYLTWTDYKRLGEVSCCHTCSLVEKEAASFGSEHKATQETGAYLSLWTIPQVMEVLHLGRSKVYELITREGLPVLRFGRSVRVSPDALRKWLKQREQEK